VTGRRCRWMTARMAVRMTVRAARMSTVDELAHRQQYSPKC
jgi:hypothetical protein